MCGIKDSRIRKRLLVEKDLTLTKPLEIATSLEGIEKEMKIMDCHLKAEVKEEGVFQLRRRYNVRKCYRYGDENHLANNCRFKNSICTVCRRSGHIARAC